MDRWYFGMQYELATSQTASLVLIKHQLLPQRKSKQSRELFYWVNAISISTVNFLKAMLKRATTLMTKILWRKVTHWCWIHWLTPASPDLPGKLKNVISMWFKQWYVHYQTLEFLQLPLKKPLPSFQRLYRQPGGAYFPVMGIRSSGLVSLNLGYQFNLEWHSTNLIIMQF